MTTWMTLWRRGFLLSRRKEKAFRDQVLTLIRGTDEVSPGKLQDRVWASQVRTWTEASHYIRAGAVDSCTLTAKRNTFPDFVCLFVRLFCCVSKLAASLLDWFCCCEDYLGPSTSFPCCQTRIRVKRMPESRRWRGLVSFLPWFSYSTSILYYDQRNLQGETSKVCCYIFIFQVLVWENRVWKERSVQNQTRGGQVISEGISFWRLRLEKADHAKLTSLLNSHSCSAMLKVYMIYSTLYSVLRVSFPVVVTPTVERITH